MSPYAQYALVAGVLLVLDVVVVGGLWLLQPGNFEWLLRHVLPNQQRGPLRRFYLTPLWFPYRVFLHHAERPDNDRALHDHPWDFWTFPFQSYDEQVASLAGALYYRTVERWRWHRRRAELRHRITVVPSGGAWTLVVAKKARREWGFWPSDNPTVVGTNFVTASEFLGLPPEDVVAREDRL